MPIVIPDSTGTKTQPKITDPDVLDPVVRQQIKSGGGSTTTRVVQSGESITDVAQQVFGDASRVEELLVLNPQLKSDQSALGTSAQITAGQTLTIPSDLEFKQNLLDLGANPDLGPTGVGPAEEVGSTFINDLKDQLNSEGSIAEMNLAINNTGSLGEDGQRVNTSVRDNLESGQISPVAQTSPIDEVPVAQAQILRTFDQLLAGELPNRITEKTRLTLGWTSSFLRQSGYIWNGVAWIMNPELFLPESNGAPDEEAKSSRSGRGRSAYTSYGGNRGGSSNTFGSRGILMNWRIGFG